MLVYRILRTCITMYLEGHVHPIHPIAVFEASNIEKSFRYLQKGDHIAKAVVTIPQDASKILSTPRRKAFTLDPDASYLLTGGLGGLGKSVASWMAECGAQHLTFLSRSAGSQESDKVFFQELASMGCSVSAITGQAQNREDLDKVIAIAPHPIKGVVHLAMVLRVRHSNPGSFASRLIDIKDGPVLDLTYEEWTAVVAPKVDGAWNLHSAFLNQHLDFFIMTSSLVTLIDQPGQSNYAAANTFLESFCQYRHTLGLPASVLGICPIEDIGFVAENTVIRKKLKSQGLYFLPERELLDYMELAVLNSHPPADFEVSTGSVDTWKSTGHLIMGLRSDVHLEDPNCQTSWRRDRRMGMYHNVRDTASGVATADSNVLKTFLSRATNHPEILGENASAEYIALEIGQKVFRFMMKAEEEVDISLSLAQIGLDSLMAIELRRWWKQAFGLDISVLEIMASGTLKELGRVAADGLKKKFFDDTRSKRM